LHASAAQELVAVIDTALEDRCNWEARPAEAANIIARTIEIRSSGNDKSDILI
jgi:hypothetical protein